MLLRALRPFLATTAFRRPACAPRSTYTALHLRRAVSSTSQPGSAKAGSGVVDAEEEIPEEVFDRVPRDVHEEMADAADGYGEQLLKVEGAPDAIKALRAMKETMKELDIDTSKNFLLDPSAIIKLASNARMREVAQTAFTEMQKAGIDMEKLEKITWAMQNMTPEKLEDEKAKEAKEHEQE